MNQQQESLQPSSETTACGCHYKATPRGDQELRQLQNRLKRMIGQLNGIGKMLEETVNLIRPFHWLSALIIV